MYWSLKTRLIFKTKTITIFIFVKILIQNKNCYSLFLELEQKGFS